MTRSIGFASLIVLSLALAGCTPAVQTTPPAGPAVLRISISGDAEVGKTVTADITGAAGNVVYRWKRGSSADGPFTAIDGATGGTYPLTSADRDKFITASVIVTRTGYSGEAESEPLGPIEAGAFNVHIIFDNLTEFKETSSVSETAANKIINDFQRGGSNNPPVAYTLSTEQDHTTGSGKSFKWSNWTALSQRVKFDKAFTPADVGKTFDISLWVYSATAATVKLGAFSLSGVTPATSWTTTPIASSPVIPIDAGWTQVVWNGYTHTDPQITQLGIQQASGVPVGTFYIDDITVKEAEAAVADPVLHIYLCIGQSNMAGRAALEAQDLRVIGDNVKLFNAAGAWEPAEPGLRGGAVNPSDMEGLNRYSNVRKTGSDSSSRQGLNPAFYFADLMKDKVPAGVSIGLVVNARGGTSLAQWTKGYSGSDDFNLYENTVTRAQAAIAAGGVLKGIIWHQGESDGGTDNYVSGLQALVADLRADLGVSAADVPFIAGEIPRYLSYQAAFNDRMPAFTSTALNTDYVRVPSHLKSIGDNTHWDSAAQRIVGSLYGQMMLKMAYNVDVNVDIGEPDPGGEEDQITIDSAKISASSTDGGNAAARVNDGDASNADGKRWINDDLTADNPSWIKIDLGAVRQVSTAEIYFFKQNTDDAWKSQTYKLQYAITSTGADGDFIDLFSGTHSSDTAFNHNTETIGRNIRWLKLVITDSPRVIDGKKKAAVNEIKLFGATGAVFEKIPLDPAKITASSTDGSNTPGKTADGDFSANDKRWIGVLSPPTPAWLKIDLGASKYVEYMDIYFRYQNHATDNTWKPHTYQIQYATTAASTDADFEYVFEETRTSLTSQAYDRVTVQKTVRWLKILITDSAKLNGVGPDKWVSINEVEVYGTP